MSITPHPGMERSGPKTVANVEEVHPSRSSNWDELPLIIFTLLAQFAVGGFWAVTWLSLASDEPHLFSLLFIGTCLGAGMFASFAHLGTKKNAWRVLSNLSKSSLSKEILFSGLFGLGWLVTMVTNSFETRAITCILGIGLIHQMSQVYRFRAAPGWHTWKTNASFMVTALLLGISIMTPLLGYESRSIGAQVPASLWHVSGAVLSVLLVNQWALMKKKSHQRLASLRVGLIVLAILSSVLTILLPDGYSAWISTLSAILIISEEALGRWVFYASRLESA